ncbi:hypothetical protein Pmani_015227 [Petrolisthes manimaculis]|uniref:RNA polymerase II-associated protein 1 n=1 Tax=Petrolisthes manimaculis TaxID=1843537 RepID=A0AAE1UA41_9EUCA|nr:hypothetical protein Pmani_015227 [Petrolisthes manimaculis]
MLVRRPQAGETEEDLVRQEQELVSGGSGGGNGDGGVRPSVTLVQKDKRKKNQDVASHCHSDVGDETTTPRSKFGRQRASKKQKEGIVDNTILKEAVRCVERGAVLGGIVERCVPTDPKYFQWQPQPTTHGFPTPLTLHTLSDSDQPAAPGKKKKSLYMQQVERQKLVRNTVEVIDSANTNTAVCVSSPSSVMGSLQDHRLDALGNRSYVIHGEGVLAVDSEVDDIHKENIEKMASMTHEERMREKQSLLDTLKPQHIQFFRALRNHKPQEAKAQILHDREDCLQTSHTLTSEKMLTERKVHKSLKCVDVEMQVPEEQCEMECENEGLVNTQHKSGLHTDKTRRDSTSGGCSEVNISTDGNTPPANNKKDISDETSETDLPIPPSEASQWLHMDKVENDKLQWMRDMPSPPPLKANEGFIARFNFDGDVLPYDAQVSYRLALHHHGREPGRAGYTLDELFTNIRSHVLEQRRVGLSTLANILSRAKEGFYDTCVKPPVAQLVVEAGGVLLLRYALDDNSPLVYGEAVRALLHLVSSEPDEHCLDLVQSWIPSGLEPGIASQVHASDKARQELDKEEGELKDFEVVKLDVIRALIRTDTHTRLRYLLEKLYPKPAAVVNILSLLTRICRHSLAASWAVASCPGLITVIIKHFLPQHLGPLLSGQTVSTMNTVYGVPLRHALKLIRVMASKGRELASMLVHTHHLMNQILVYVSLDPSEVSVPTQEMLMLCQEAYATWSVFLAYGLSKSVEAVVNFYPLFVKQLIFYRDKVDVNEATDENQFNYDVGAQIMTTLTRAINVAASHSLLEAKMQLNQGTVITSDGNTMVLQPPALTWLHLRDLPHLVETCLAKWLTQAQHLHCLTFSARKLIGSCCDFLSTYYIKWKDQTSYNPDIARKIIESLYNNVISSLLTSESFDRFMTTIVPHSSLISSQKSGVERDPINIGSLGCVCIGGQIVPIIKPNSPFPLLLPLSTFLFSLHSLHTALDNTSTTHFLDSQEVSDYLSKVCASQKGLSGQWLTRVETHFICNLLLIAAKTHVNKKELYHQSALCIMNCIHKGDEFLIKDLLTQVICDPSFVPDMCGVNNSVQNLSVRDYQPLKSPALAQPILTPAQLTTNIYQSLSAIGNELAKTLVTKRELEASLVLKTGIPFAVNGITVSHTESSLSLDLHWPLSPIKYAFTASQIPPKSQKSQNQHRSDQSPPEDIVTVTRCLQMTYMGLRYRRNTLLHHSSYISWLQYLSLTFLSASDIFLDPIVSSYLQGCIAEILKYNGYAKLNARTTIDCFTSITDWYKRLVEQYMSVSYGDSTFALYLMVPLQQYFSRECRLILWGDVVDALQFIFLTSEQVEQFIPHTQFEEPRESDEGLVHKYRAAVGTGIISKTKNTFLYQLATHHITLYLSH